MSPPIGLAIESPGADNRLRRAGQKGAASRAVCTEAAEQPWLFPAIYHLRCGNAGESGGRDRGLGVDECHAIGASLARGEQTPASRRERRTG
jgi:hypothetical protein